MLVKNLGTHFMFSYPKDAKISLRFKHFLYYCTRSACIPHEKNQLEKIGDFCLYPIEQVPGKLWKMVGDPRGIAVLVWVLLEVIISVYSILSIQ